MINWSEKKLSSKENVKGSISKIKKNIRTELLPENNSCHDCLIACQHTSISRIHQHKWRDNIEKMAT